MPELLRSAKLAVEKGLAQGHNESYIKQLSDYIIPALVEALHKVLESLVHLVFSNDQSYFLLFVLFIFNPSDLGFDAFEHIWCAGAWGRNLCKHFRCVKGMCAGLWHQLIFVPCNRTHKQMNVFHICSFSCISPSQLDVNTFYLHVTDVNKLLT